MTLVGATYPMRLGRIIPINRMIHMDLERKVTSYTNHTCWLTVIFSKVSGRQFLAPRAVWLDLRYQSES